MIRLTREQIRRIDRLAIERYNIPGIVLMENAARAVVDAACAMLNNDCMGEIVILCGGGNNGGDGLAVARHLHNRGADVGILLTSDPTKYQGEAAANWQIVQAMELRAVPWNAEELSRRQSLLIIDAIFGTGLTQLPRDPFGEIVKVVGHMRVPVLAVDIPSGMDCDTGKPLGPACMKAARTVTFVAEKIGFAEPTAAEYLGQVIVGDIGCPRELIGEVLGQAK
jgi:NAD(P)H-hydrate epimerase